MIAIILGAMSSSLFATNLVIRNLLGTHLNIGMDDHRDDDKEKSSSPQTFSDILFLQQELKKQNTYDLLGTLDFATTEPARLVILQNYLTASQQLLQESQPFLEQEKVLIEQYSKKIQDCEQPIKQENASFTTAVQRYDFASAQRLSQHIAELRGCIAENTVYYKEHVLYRDTTLPLQTTLQKKIDYLTTNKERIARYYEMLKPQLLQDLYAISRTLEVNYAGEEK
jgi:hypothetical protein